MDTGEPYGPTRRLAVRSSYDHRGRAHGGQCGAAVMPRLVGGEHERSDGLGPARPTGRRNRHRSASPAGRPAVPGELPRHSADIDHRYRCSCVRGPHPFHPDAPQPEPIGRPPGNARRQRWTHLDRAHRPDLRSWRTPSSTRTQRGTAPRRPGPVAVRQPTSPIEHHRSRDWADRSHQMEPGPHSSFLHSREILRRRWRPTITARNIRRPVLPSERFAKVSVDVLGRYGFEREVLPRRLPSNLLVAFQAGTRRQWAHLGRVAAR
jgi:hypothetical protein